MFSVSFIPFLKFNIVLSLFDFLFFLITRDTSNLNFHKHWNLPQGLVEHVLKDADNKKTSRGLDQKLSSLQKERDQVRSQIFPRVTRNYARLAKKWETRWEIFRLQAVAEHKEKRARVDALKEELQKKVNEYMKTAEGGTSLRCDLAS